MQEYEDASLRSRSRRRVPVFLTQEEALRLIRAVGSYHERNRGDHRTFPWFEARDRAILLLLLGTGMRVSELVGLNLNSIQEDGETARVIVLGKGGRERMLKLNNTAYQALREYLAQRPSDGILREIGRRYFSIATEPASAARGSTKRSKNTSGRPTFLPRRPISPPTNCATPWPPCSSPTGKTCAWFRRSSATPAFKRPKFIPMSSIPKRTKRSSAWTIFCKRKGLCCPFLLQPFFNENFRNS